MSTKTKSKGIKSAIVIAAVFACGGHEPGVDLPRPVSAPPQATHAGLHAGFGRADITPAPGFPLAGNSLEGGQATGYRHRLYARALVLEDGSGERFAFLTADIGLFSSNLHRLTAQRVHERTGIGADRLVISATHTHSGPGSHFVARSYNEESAAYAGYDPDMVEFLVERFARAIDSAYADMQPAKAAWDTVIVSIEEGLTRNRSLDAFILNTNPITEVRPELPGETPAQTRDRQRREAVDRVLRLLRVDQCETGWTDCQPRGAFSVFAIHGTGNPPVNTLIDGDIHAIVERELEQHIESLNSALPSSDPSNCASRNDDGVTNAANCAFASRAFHLFANGTEGDVSPNHDAGTRCGIEEVDRRVPSGDARLRFRMGRRPAGPRTPNPPEAWRRLGSRSVSDCLARARQSTNRLGQALSQHAIRAFSKAGNNLTQDLTIQRAFRSYGVRQDSLSPPLCPEPRSGTPNLGGAEDGRTRMYRWKFLFFIPSGIDEGGAAINRQGDTGCNGAKLIVLGPLQGLVVGRGGLPEFLQLTVVRIGNGVLGVVPLEATTEAGMRMKNRIRSAFSNDIDYVGIIGLANGYMQYLTTREEYDYQSYEGGSNLYGPGTADTLTAELETLAVSITRGIPIVHIGAITATPGKEQQILFDRSNGPRLSEIRRAVTSLSCAGNVLNARWIDAYPGLFVPADGQVLEVQQRNVTGGWDVVAWDDDRFVEVHALGPKDTGYEWSVRWSPPVIEPGSYRLALVQRTVGDEGMFAAVLGDGQPVPVVDCGA